MFCSHFASCAIGRFNWQTGTGQSGNFAMLSREAGATPHEITAVTGHQTLEEVERYTKTASRKKAADVALAKLIRPIAS
jgi:hypothetical protein